MKKKLYEKPTMRVVKLQPMQMLAGSGVEAERSGLNFKKKMSIKQKVFSILALLLMAAVGARAQTTYTVTVKDGTEDAANWSADPNPAGEGQTVTIKYNGKKKVKRVMAVVQKAALRPLAEGHALTASALGEIVGSDGRAYAVADKDNLPTFVTAVAMIAYVDSETDNAAYKHGLAIALSDEEERDWSDAKSTCEGKTAVSGAAWMLPSQNQWNAMFKAFGGDEGSCRGLNTALATAGGDSSKLQEYLDRYWSSTLEDEKQAWCVGLSNGRAYWWYDIVYQDKPVRACLAF